MQVYFLSPALYVFSCFGLVLSFIFLLLALFSRSAVRSNLKQIGLWAVVLVITATFCFFSASASIDQAKLQDSTEWVAAGCPVYKGDCGTAGNGRECTIRTSHPGPINVGNIVVSAYPTCSIK